jgi:deoxycytidylate deaminase
LIICKQDGHAEIDAIKNAKGDTEEAIMYLIGHDYCCEPCLASMKKAGIKTVIFNSYPKGFKKNCFKKIFLAKKRTQTEAKSARE